MSTTWVAVPTGRAAERADLASLFDRCAWLYAFCREHLFRDDTDRIASALWSGAPPVGSTVLELGCGPGLYARRLAERFGQLRAIGIDRSERQLRRARARAAARGLASCRFEQGNVLALGWPSESVDAVIASRLFTVVAERERALAEMHRVLRPGGRCFVAEPCSMLRATLPLLAMWLVAGVLGPGDGNLGGYHEPRRAAVLTADRFGGLIESQPWRRVWLWQDVGYRYAVCEKDPGSVGLPATG